MKHHESSLTISPSTAFIISLLIVGLISSLDYYTKDLSLVVLYVAAILFSSWFAEIWQGLVVTLFSCIGIIVSDYFVGTSTSFIHYWNIILECVVLAIVSLLTSSLRSHHLKEEFMARYDHLTGIGNRSSFFQLAQQELYLSKRFNRPLTLAYIDLDNFKQINDLQGHQEGDRVLIRVADTLKSALREIDIVARMGGDEFVILLPETGYEHAKPALRKLQSSLLMEMEKNQWATTFSIGAISCKNFDGTVDELLKIADKCMYSVKAECKNGIFHEELN